MAIPPIENNPPDLTVPSKSPFLSKQLEQSTLFFFINEQISQNVKNRENKIYNLPQNSQALIFSFFKELASIESLIHELSTIPLPGSKDAQPLPSEKEEYERIMKQLHVNLESLKQAYSSFGFDTSFITTLLRSPQFDRIDVRFTIEMIKNCFFSRISYLLEIEQFIEKNKMLILKEFFPEGASKFRLEALSFKVDMVSSETHHLGRAPAFITFTHTNSVLFKIVYKPRLAAVDRAVLDTFTQINQLPPEQKSYDILLPIYKILNFENRSLWEYIEGENIVTERSAGFFIRSNLEGKRRENAEKYLNRMDAILSKMGISDLHRENVKIKNYHFKDKDVEIVPIDLENLQKGQSTQLGGHPKQVILTPFEEQKIKNFELAVSDCPCRYLPLSTQVMASLIGDFHDLDDLTHRLFQQIEVDNFIFEINFTQFKKLIFNSILYHDIPYFTEYKNIVYYGLPSEGQQIAKKGG